MNESEINRIHLLFLVNYCIIIVSFIVSFIAVIPYSFLQILCSPSLWTALSTITGAEQSVTRTVDVRSLLEYRLNNVSVNSKKEWLTLA